MSSTRDRGVGETASAARHPGDLSIDRPFRQRLAAKLLLLGPLQRERHAFITDLQVMFL